MSGPFLQANPEYPCVDLWPPGTLTAEKKAAYDALAKRGEITGVRVRRQGEYMAVSYLSTLPPDWTRYALKQTAKEREMIFP